MRVVFAALVGLAFAAGSAGAATGSWRITKDHWDAADEEGFGKFVAMFGESDCKDPASCWKSAANPYRDTDPPELKMDGDCADFIYQMRAYYAWKNGLPFSDPQHLLLMDMIRTRDAEGAGSMVHLHIRRTRLLIQAMDPGVSSHARVIGKRP